MKWLFWEEKIPDNAREAMVYRATMMVVRTLCLVIISMVLVMCVSLMFIDGVDNQKIFELISPAFQTIIGGFIGLLAGLKISAAMEPDAPQGGTDAQPDAD